MIKSFSFLFSSILLVGPTLFAQEPPTSITLKANKKNIMKFEKSDFEIYVPITGTSAAYEEYDIIAQFDGRMEEIFAEQFDYVGEKEVLATMVTTEMAAMIDTSHGLSRKQMEKRWKGVFDYHSIRPGDAGVVTRVHVEAKQRVSKGDRLFTVARKVMIIAKNTEPVFSPVKNGLPAQMRYSRNENIKFETAVSRFMSLAPNSFYYRLWLDIKELNDDIIVGARFNGFLFLGRTEDSVIVPRSDIIRLGRRKFMLIEVNTGLVSESKAEITKTVDNYVKPEILKMGK